MARLIVQLFVLLVTTQIITVLCQSDYDYEWNRDGIVYLKPSLDKSLCVKTENYYSEQIFLKLISCSTYENAYSGQRRLYLEKTDGIYRRIRAFNFPASSPDPYFSCFYAGNSENSIVLTDRCNKDNPWHMWSLRTLGGNKLQWVHMKTGNCVRAPSIANGVELRTAKCDLNDKNQIWEVEFLQEEFKFDEFGKVSLKSKLNQALCFSTQQYVDGPGVMNVAPCTSQEDGDDITLGKLDGGYFQFKTLTTAIYRVFTCLSANTASDRISLKNNPDCNYNDELQHWKFIETGILGEVLVFNKQLQKCVQVNDDRKTTRTAGCNAQEIKQIWKIQHA